MDIMIYETMKLRINILPVKTLEEIKIAVGPSAPPIIPIAPEALSGINSEKGMKVLITT